MSGQSLSPGLFGLAVHVLAPDGTRVRSFGEREGPVVARDPNRTRRVLAEAGPGSVWVGSRYDEYRIELWTLAGQRVQVLEAEVDWFDPVGDEPDSPPAPEAVLYSMRQDEEGLLWLLFSVPGRRWREASVRDPEAPHGWRTVNEEYLRDTIVDVIDPSEQRLLSRIQIPERLIKLFGGAGVYSAVKEVDLDEQSLRIHVIRLQLDGYH